MFILTSVYLLVFGTLQVSCQHVPQETLDEFSHEVDVEFVNMDTDKNGTVDRLEFEVRVKRQDFDNDGCISFHEFISVRNRDPIRFVFLIFDHLDRNKDGCLMVNEEIAEFDQIDINPTDSQIEKQELKVYYDQFFKIIFPFLGYQTISP